MRRLNTSKSEYVSSPKYEKHGASGLRKASGWKVPYVGASPPFGARVGAVFVNIYEVVSYLEF